jgi:predicted nucleic acid-binding Zn ribbon protein
MKKCPFCAEDIQDEAIKCKHCGEFLEEASRPSVAAEKIQWYFRTPFIVLAVCCVGPLRKQTGLTSEFFKVRFFWRFRRSSNLLCLI